jgi:flagellar biosynthetic protein FlhB
VRLLIYRDFVPLFTAGAALLAVSLGAQLATTRLGVSLKGLTPNFKRLNFLTKLRELPRQNIPALVQAVVLLPLFSAAVYGIVKENWEALIAMPLQAVEQSSRQMAVSTQDLIWKGAMLFVVMGAIDFVRQNRRYMADLRMSKQELREEAKEMEGNPQVRARVRQLRREWLRRRMMSQVPTATAVIVNPTHYAVAIRYAIDSMTAPTVVAKGKNYLALRIRKKAVEHQIPIIENPPLAQALYKSVDVGQEVPAHLYRAVAEILAYIYRIMGGRLPA